MRTPLVGVLPDSTVRAATLADVSIITDLVRRVSTAAIGVPDGSEDEVRDDLVGPRFDIGRDTALVIGSDGRVVVYAQAHDEHDDRAFLDVFVSPDFADGMFAELSGAALSGAKNRIGEALSERGAITTTVSAGLYHGELRMLAAYEAAGLSRERVYWRMSIDLELDALPLVQRTAGVTIRPVDPDDDAVMAQALALRNDSFSEHHGHVDVDFDHYAQAWRSAAKYDRSAWWFASLDGIAVGLCLGDEAKLEEGAGYIQTLGVSKSARGRGIARALLLTAFEEYRSRGRQSVQLGVDSINETGATRLYESVGMKPILALDSLVMTLTTGAKS